MAVATELMLAMLTGRRDFLNCAIKDFSREPFMDKLLCSCYKIGRALLCVDKVFQGNRPGTNNRQVLLLTMLLVEFVLERYFLRAAGYPGFPRETQVNFTQEIFLPIGDSQKDASQRCTAQFVYLFMHFWNFKILGTI